MDRAVKHEASVLILLCTAYLLVLFNVTSALLFSSFGSTFFWMVKAAMWMTGAFAITGGGFGLMRSNRLGRTNTEMSAGSDRLGL
jgi:hypothetical protein